MTSPLLRSKIAILQKCHIWHHSKKKCHIQGVPPILSWKHPVKKIQETTKSADMKKTETEKNRADTILVFLLQHTSEYRIIFYMCPSFLLLQSAQSLNSQLRKNNNSRVLLLRQIM